MLKHLGNQCDTDDFNDSNRIFVTVGSDEKVKFTESIGATKAINYKTEDWSKVVIVTIKAIQDLNQH